jgi:putative ABC transport system permease protein
MIKSYLKTAWRSLLRGKSFSMINIGGLVIGMAGAGVILLWLQNEISFDKFHTNKDRLYQIYGLTNNTDGHATAIPVVPQPLGPALKQSLPEVEAQTRVKDVNNFLLTANNKGFTGISGSFVDPAFLQMFTFPLRQGSINEQIKNLYSITITEKLAKKLFGNEDAVGKIIKIDSVDNFTVTGVLKNLPSNTRFEFEYLLSWDYLKKLGWSNESWLSNNTPVYVLLRPNANLHTFNAKIKNLSRVNAGRNDIWTHFLFPLRQWHLYSKFENAEPVGGRIDVVRLFAIIAAFILLIACINFMNLSTARSEKRAREVGIRKVAGAGKGLLIGQFIVESFLTACIAGALALLILQLVLSPFNKIIGAPLSIPYSNPHFWVWAMVFISITSLLAGSYPAFYLSSFKPVSIFKKQFKNSSSVISPRKILVVVQFAFATILIISTIVVRNQVQYAQTRDKGYSNKDLIHVDFVGDIDKNYALIKQQLINSNIASSVSKNMIDITHGGGHTWGLRWPNENPKDTNTTITLYSTDADWVTTASLHLIAGRDIDIYKYPSDSFSVLLNETAVKLMGFPDAVGQTIFMRPDNTPLRVVGVVKDYIIGSPYETVPPTVIQGPGAWFNTMHIKLNPAQATAANLAKAENVFKKYNPAYPFDFKFVDEEYAKQFDNEQRSKAMAGLFAALAIFISCLGLFGLSAYAAETRIKEIGVRKVLGASVLSITKLLSLDFVKLVFVSLVIAAPVAAYVMNRWLQDYAYRIKLGWEIFFGAGLLAVSIALVTVSFQSIKAAIANPVKSLRTE